MTLPPATVCCGFAASRRRTWIRATTRPTRRCSTDAPTDAPADGGRVSLAPDALRVEGADAVTLIVSAATGFNGFDKDPARDGRDPGPIVAAEIGRARRTGWTALRDEHVADHRALFDRTSLDL